MSLYLRTLLYLSLTFLIQASKMFSEYRNYQRYDKSLPIDGGRFVMGLNDPKFSLSGEYPTRKLIVQKFAIDQYPVTNAQFWKFMQLTGHSMKTRAQREGFSYVFVTSLAEKASLAKNKSVVGEPWWIAIKGAKWNHPEGPMSNISLRMHHPAVHVSQQDAIRYCEWLGKRLPSEAEWEYAARGALRGKPYPWGDVFQPKRMNLWQGLFPYENKAYDEWEFVSPVDAYPPQNDYGLYDMLGNVWEWTSTAYRQHPSLPVSSTRQYILKGASFIDFREDSVDINHPARCSTRLARDPSFTAQNVGFRCASDVSSKRNKIHFKHEMHPGSIENDGLLKATVPHREEL